MAAWATREARHMTDEQRRDKVAALERMFSLQSPQHPRLTVSLGLALALALFEAFSILFEHAAVTLFPFHRLLDKFGGRPRKESK